MISIENMRNIATTEKAAEEKAKSSRLQKELTMYRDKLNEKRPMLMEYIQKQIISAMKSDKGKAGLYNNDAKSTFDGITCNWYRNLAKEFFRYLWAEEYKDDSALEIALKELAADVRTELLEAGIKEIRCGCPSTGGPDVILVF